MSTVLCREESSCANVTVFLTRRYSLRVSSELQLLVHDCTATVNQDKVTLFSHSVPLLFPGSDGISELQMLQFESLSEAVR